MTVGRTQGGIIELQAPTVPHQSELLDRSQRLVETLAGQLLEARRVVEREEAEGRLDESETGMTGTRPDRLVKEPPMAEQTRTKTSLQRPSSATQAPPCADVETVGPDVDGLFARVSEILVGFDDLHARAVDAYRPIVAELLRTGCQDRKHIERTLDGLLGFCGHGAALALYKRLCRYYWDIDPMATADYVYAYRDMFDSDEPSEVASSER